MRQPLRLFRVADERGHLVPAAQQGVEHSRPDVSRRAGEEDPHGELIILLGLQPTRLRRFAATAGQALRRFAATAGQALARFAATAGQALRRFAATAGQALAPLCGYGGAGPSHRFAATAGQALAPLCGYGGAGPSHRFAATAGQALRTASRLRRGRPSHRFAATAGQALRTASRLRRGRPSHRFAATAGQALRPLCGYGGASPSRRFAATAGQALTHRFAATAGQARTHRFAATAWQARFSPLRGYGVASPRTLYHFSTLFIFLNGEPQEGLWELWDTRSVRVPRSGGRVLGVHGSGSFHRRGAARVRCGSTSATLSGVPPPHCASSALRRRAPRRGGP